MGGGRGRCGEVAIVERFKGKSMFGLLGPAFRNIGNKPEIRESEDLAELFRRERQEVGRKGDKAIAKKI